MKEAISRLGQLSAGRENNLSPCRNVFYGCIREYFNFAFAFVSIGAETSIREFGKIGRAPAIAFTVAQSFNIVWTLVISHFCDFELEGCYLFNDRRLSNSNAIQISHFRYGIAP